MQDKETVVLKINDDPLDQITKAFKETLYKDNGGLDRPGNCPGCDSPYSEVGVLVGDVCYDCAKLCPHCNTNPRDPQQRVCPECATAIGSQQCIECDLLHYCDTPDIKPDSDKCIESKDRLTQNVETK